MFTKTTCTALAALAVLGFAASGHAAPATGRAPDTPSVTLSVGDLGGGGESTAKAVLQRIYNAARDVCAEETNPLACRDNTVARAVASLNNPTVTALNAGRQPATVLATSGH